MKAMGMEKFVTISRPDKKTSYMIYPGLQSYLEMPMQDSKGEDTPEDFKLEYVLQPPMYVVDTARLEDVLRQMQKAKTHFGFVVDEHGGVEGRQLGLY